MLYTQYVWTKYAGEIARDNNLNETRAEGFPARFAYEPMEKNMHITKAWLEAGIIRKVEEKLPFFQFYWKDNATSASWEMMHILKENHIPFRNGIFGSLEAKIGDDDDFHKVEYYHVEGNLYGFIVKPRTTSEYFGISPEELYAKNNDGYTKEENLLCDNNVHAKPFAKDLYHAIRKAADYIQIGCENVEILQCINNKYAVVCQ